MRIADAARALGTTPRMLRYREGLGLLPPAADGPGRHRRYHEDDLAAASWAALVEQRYSVPPQALAFALRAVCEAPVAADVRRLGELTDRITPAVRALDFDQVKAQRLLQPRRPVPGGSAAPG